MPIKVKPDNLAHFKKIILFDGTNYLYAHGSANFTCAGLIKNGESFLVDRSWGSDESKLRILKQRENFDLIFKKEHESYIYISPEEVTGIVRSIGNTKTEIELLEDAYHINSNIQYPAEIPEAAIKVFEKRQLNLTID